MEKIVEAIREESLRWGKKGKAHQEGDTRLGSEKRRLRYGINGFKRRNDLKKVSPR